MSVAKEELASLIRGYNSKKEIAEVVNYKLQSPFVQDDAKKEYATFFFGLDKKIDEWYNIHVKDQKLLI